MRTALVSATESGTITGVPALIIMLLIVGGIFGLGVLVGRLSKRPKQ